MNVLVDIDGVCSDFIKGFYRTAQQYDPTIPLRTEETHKDWHIFEGIRDEIKEKVWGEIKKSPNWWANLDCILSWPDRYALRLASIKPNIALYFCTSRPGYNVKQQTEVWFRSIIPGFDPTVLVVERMHYKPDIARALDIDISIEDNAENAYEIGKVIGQAHSYLIPRLYNRQRRLNPDCGSVLNFLAKAGVELNIE